MSKKIIFSVLNWGLGHASRSAAIISELLKNDVEIILASDGVAKDYLHHQFPTLKIYTLSSLEIRYPFRSLFWNMSYQWPRVLKSIKQEYKDLQNIIRIEQADMLISDNRYGCYSKKIPSILITHQLNLPISNPIVKMISDWFIHKLIHKFHECWIPDYQDRRLSGELSNQKLNIPISFIGPLSHFLHELPKTNEIKRDLIVILSGPEPQRTQFEELIISQLKHQSLSILIVQGLPSRKGQISKIQEEITLVPYLGASDLLTEISISRQVICRSGYSSIMDLDIISKPSLLVPTPGQSEQEYLAKKAQESKRHYCVSQDKLDLSTDLYNIPLDNIMLYNNPQKDLSDFIRMKLNEI